MVVLHMVALFFVVIVFVGPGFPFTVVKKEDLALLCRMGSGESSNKCFLSVYDPAKYNLSHEDYNRIKEGDELECEIIEYDYNHMSFQLRFLSSRLEDNPLTEPD